MTDDERADQLAADVAYFDNLIQDHPNLPLRVKRRARNVHALIEELRDELRDAEVIQPFSGGEEKPPGP